MKTAFKRKTYLLFSLLCIIVILIIAVFIRKSAEKNDQLDTTSIILKSSTDPSKNIPHTPLRVIYNKKYGMTKVIMCLVKDTNWVLIKKECNDLLSNEEYGFIYCYDDSLKILNINRFTNALDALPDEGKDYVLEFKKEPNEIVTVTKFINNVKNK